MGLPEHLQGLLRATAYPHPVDAVRVVETPLSWVLIAGERTYKLKRPVRLPFVNQSRLEDRQRLCLEELRLNRRFAPGLYLGVTPISAEDGLARIGGDEPIEHAVVMRSFAADDELDRLVAMQRVAPDALESFGRWLAQVQAGLPRLGGSPAPAVPGPAGAAARNMQECLAAGAAFGTATRIATIAAQMSRQFDARAPVLAKRLADGFVRECHADLHLSNIVRIDGRLLPFDCLEFDPALRWIDVAEDVAFLYMDLLAYDAPTLATGFLNGWLQASGDYEACTLLRLYGSDRAMVRAKVMALRGVTALLQARHGHYLRIAASLLQSPRPRCVMMCGVPGSGKSWLAARLAAARSAVIVRSDIERRRLGAPYDERGTALVYARMSDCARGVLEGRFELICDANYGQHEQRRELAALCRAQGIPLIVVHCHAPPPVLRERIRRRQAGGTDPSEADLAVLQLQQERREPIGAGEELDVLDVDTTREDVVDAVLARIPANH